MKGRNDFLRNRFGRSVATSADDLGDNACVFSLQHLSIICHESFTFVSLIEHSGGDRRSPTMPVSTCLCRNNDLIDRCRDFDEHR
jgi:hypothetical protein